MKENTQQGESLELCDIAVHTSSNYSEKFFLKEKISLNQF